MKILVVCEESQAICLAFRERGFEAYSNDLQECSGGYPDFHLQMDCFEAIEQIKPALLIGHPPCTFLTVTANRWLKDQPPLKSGALVGEVRRKAKKEAEEFFMALWNCGVDRICLENPVGSFNSIIKPTQLIHPYYFGDEARKATCLWLKNLPLLYHSKTMDLFEDKITHVSQGESAYWTDSKTGKLKRQPLWYARAKQSSKDLNVRSKERSKTFPGIAAAMAEQWGDYLLSLKDGTIFDNTTG